MEVVLTPKNVNDYHLIYQNAPLHTQVMERIESGESVKLEVEIQTNAQFLVVDIEGNLNLR
jgi:predicted RNA-binding protein